MTDEPAAPDLQRGPTATRPNPDLDTSPSSGAPPTAPKPADPARLYDEPHELPPDSYGRIGVPVKPQPVETEGSGPEAEASTPEQ